MIPGPRGGVIDGFGTVTDLLGRTLGPSRRGVLNQVGRSSSEFLTDSATVVRRITSLPGVHESAGAAIAKDLVESVVRRHGDGGASAAVLARSMLAHALRVTGAGANPVLVRKGIALAVAAACDAIKAHAEPVTDLVGLARAAIADAEIARVIAEVVEELGPDGAVEIEEHTAAGLEYDYLEGARWRARPAYRDLLAGASTELTLIEPVIVVADLELTRAGQARAILEVARALPGRTPMLVVARDVSGEALSMLRLNDALHAAPNAPVALTTATTGMTEDLQDIAVLTGAEVLADEMGRPVERAVPAQAGSARRVLIERGFLTITAGRGDRAAIADKAARMRTAAWESDGAVADRLRLRQARLLTRVAGVRVGAPSEPELEARTLATRRAVLLLRRALQDGAVPGGGVAFLDCIPAVGILRGDLAGTDAASGADAVLAALQAPFCRIVHNAGMREPAAVLARLRGQGPGYGVDVTTGAEGRLRDAGILDVASVCAGALEAAGEVAGLLACSEVVAGHG